MTILLNFLTSLALFIYGINLFSSSLENLYQKRIKTLLEKYTKTPFKGIILGTIITILVESSSLTTITTLSFVNSNLITFHNSLGIMMGANLGTCITSFLIAFLHLSEKNLIFVIFNPNNYIPLLLILGLFYTFKKKYTKSSLVIGLGLFMLGLLGMETSLTPLKDYAWFQNLLISFNNPLVGVLVGIIVTSIIQSSSAGVAILQTISENNSVTYLMAIPLILGENIGTCLTTIVASFKTSKNAKKVALSHLLYNIFGTIIFLGLFYLLYFFQSKILYLEVNSLKIAIIHTLFNFFSILLFYPFLRKFENLINKLVK